MLGVLIFLIIVNEELLEKICRLGDEELVFSERGRIIPPKNLRLCSGYKCHKSGSCLRSLAYYSYGGDDRLKYNYVKTFKGSQCLEMILEEHNSCRGYHLVPKSEQVVVSFNVDHLNEEAYQKALPLIVETYYLEEDY
jgi:hypothetical protein